MGDRLGAGRPPTCLFHSREWIVTRYLLLGTLLASALVLAAFGTAGRAEDKEHKHDEHSDKCAKACATCLLECESCAHHCAHLVAKGEKEHLRTLGTCADCGDVCALAAKVVARKGPTAVTVCEACAKVCDECAKACEEVGPKDEHMKRCAKACKDCAAACREMIKHAGHHKD
jgi:hypothetical protein